MDRIMYAVTIFYPVLRTWRSIETEDADLLRHWSCYWIVYTVYNYWSDWIKMILWIVPLFRSFEFCFFVYLARPSEAEGFLTNCVKPFLERTNIVPMWNQHLSMILDEFVTASYDPQVLFDKMSWTLKRVIFVAGTLYRSGLLTSLIDTIPQRPLVVIKSTLEHINHAWKESESVRGDGSSLQSEQSREQNPDSDHVPVLTE